MGTMNGDVLVLAGADSRAIREATLYARVVLGRLNAVVVAAIVRADVEAIALVEPGDVSPEPDGGRFALAWRFGDEEIDETGAEDFYRKAGLTTVDYDAVGAFFFVGREGTGPFTRVRYFAAGDMWIASDWTWGGELIGDATIVDGRGVTAYAEELR